jgi:hypothetical protein
LSIAHLYTEHLDLEQRETHGSDQTSKWQEFLEKQDAGGSWQGVNLLQMMELVDNDVDMIDMKPVQVVDVREDELGADNRMDLNFGEQI